MKKTKIPINTAIEQLKISRTTFYKYLKKTGIKPRKSANRSYITNNEIARIKALLPNPRTTEKTTDEHHEQTQEIKKVYQTQIKSLEKSLLKSESENKKLIFEMGKLQGIAQNLKDQNDKLQKIMIEPIQAPQKNNKISLWQYCQNIWKQL